MLNKNNYISSNSLKTFENVSFEWINYYRKTVRKETFSRTVSDYKRFFIYAPFNDKDIGNISDFDIEDFVHDEIIKKKLRKQGYKNLKAILNGIFSFAYKKKYISINPMTTVKISTSNISKPTKQPKSETVFTTKDADLIKSTIKSDRENYESSVPFAILLAFQLGVRVSELIALKWSDIDNNYIHIQRQEVSYTTYDHNLISTGTVHDIVEYTKTDASDRFLPLTPEATIILSQTQAFNLANHINSTYIFSDVNGNNFNRQRINNCLYSYCKKINISKKSSHKIRKNVISTLLDNIPNKESVRNFAGHEDLQTTLKYYYKDITDDMDFYNRMCDCL